MNARILKVGGPLLVLALVLAAIAAFPAALSAYVVRPVAVSLWAMWRIVVSVDQRVYWILLVVLCSLLMLRVFSIHGPVAPASARPPEQQPTRVEHWRRLIENAQRTRDGDATLRASLRNLLTSTLSQADRPAATNLPDALAVQRIALPPGMRAYLGLDAEGEAETERPSSLWARFRQRMRAASVRDEVMIEEVLQWMERAMEISHDQ